MKAPHQFMSEQIIGLNFNHGIDFPLDEDYERSYDIILNDTLMEEQTMLMKFAGYLTKQGLIEKLDFEELENLTFDFYNETYEK